MNRARIKFTLPDEEEIVVWCQRDEVEEIIEAVDSEFQVEVLYAEEVESSKGRRDGA